MKKWVEEVLTHHRSPPKVKKVHIISDVEKWPTQEGAWEIAKVTLSICLNL